MEVILAEISRASQQILVDSPEAVLIKEIFFREQMTSLEAPADTKDLIRRQEDLQEDLILHS